MKKIIRGGSTSSVKLLWGVNLLSVMPYLCLVFFKKEEEKTRQKNQNRTPHWDQLHVLNNFSVLWAVGQLILSLACVYSGFFSVVFFQ